MGVEMSKEACGVRWRLVWLVARRRVSQEFLGNRIAVSHARLLRCWGRR
jgi:hypothetical protein